MDYSVLQSFDNRKEFKDSFKELDAIVKLETTWEDPSNCEWCYNNEESKPLFETDKSSLTPTLIYTIPTAKTVENIELLSAPFNKVKFTRALIYRKAKRNNEHYLFSTNTNILIEDNKELIERWLEDNIKPKLEIKTTDRVVIISPCHYSNSQFINLVNDKLFKSSATVIHHQVEIDYLANFKLLNEAFLKQGNAKVFFVDDSLISGGSFFRIYDAYRFTENYLENFSGAIFLSNKSSDYIHKRVTRAAKGLYSFVNVNLSSHPKINNKKPLEHEARRYEMLFENTLHDAVKKHFKNKFLDVNGGLRNKKTKDNQREWKEEYKRDGHLRLFKATHHIYEFFRNLKDIKDFKIEKLLEYCNFNEEGQEKIEVKMAIMKVLSQYPLSLHKLVRETVFKWHKEWFEKETNEEIKEKLINKEYSYSDFRLQKFLIRRAVFLGSNVILEPEFLVLLGKIFDWASIRLIELETESNEEQGSIFYYHIKDEKDNLKDFHLFILFQYIELFHKNGWTANKLLENIDLEEVKCHFEIPQAKKFVRMLKVESATVLNEFYELLNKNIEWVNLYNSRHSIANKINIDNKKIVEFFNSREEIEQKNKFKLSDSVLKLENSHQYFNYLWIKQYLNTDLRFKTSDNLHEKTGAIFYKLKEMFNEGDSGKESSNRVGAFFIVNDGKDRPHLVYDRNEKDEPFLYVLDENIDMESLIFKFLEGKEMLKTDEFNESNNSENIRILNTINEYIRDGSSENDWVDLYSLDEKLESEKFPPGPNWLLMIRISNSKFRPLGVIGIYAKNKPKSILLSKQLLMLLREDLGKFIEKHHRHDEFSNLIKEREKNAYQFMLKHGFSRIETTLEYYKHKIEEAGIKNLEYCKDKIEEAGFKNLEYYKDEIEEASIKNLNYFKYFDVALMWMKGKIFLMDLMNKIGEVKDERFYEVFKLSDFISDIYSMYRYVFTFYNSSLDFFSTTDPNDIDTSISLEINIEHSDLNLELKLPRKLRKQLIFEIFYNIRKHPLDNYFDHILENKLIINICIVRTNNIYYLCFTNNYCMKNVDENQINLKIKKSQQDGLNMINSILKKSLKKEIFIKIKSANSPERRLYSIYIPIKTV